jgi:2-oxoglutarate dehydrogenase E2 component (dihydrolipoamide succinyltransferase)
MWKSGPHDLNAYPPRSLAASLSSSLIDRVSEPILPSSGIMPILDVKIPAMGESITSGVLAKWHVQDGDIVKKDQPLFELETDKINSEATAEAAGRIALKVTAGSEVKIGQLVATIEPAAVAGEPASEGGRPAPDTGGAESATAIRNPASGVAPSPSLTTSPAVRRLASETGVDPATVAATGKGGRVTKGDLLAAQDAGSRKPAPVEASAGRPEPGKPVTPAPAESESIRSPVADIRISPAARQIRRKLSPLRQRLAQRLVQAQHEAAMLTTFNEVDMSAVRDLRTRYQEDFTRKHGVKLGFMSFFVKAVVRALQEVPVVNAQLEGDTVLENHFYHIGVAVSTDRGLLVPVLRDCDRLGFAEIEKHLADVAKRAREGKITLADLEGGVFTITNGGIFGSLLSTPILNAPQCAILGMHAIQDRPVAVNGQVVIRPMMYLALSYDHRLVDGRDAVTFLVRVKQAIEDPARLLLSV